PAVRKLGPAQKLFDFPVAVSGSEKSMVHPISAFTAAPLLHIDPEGGTQGGARIPRGRLDPDTPEGAPITYPSIHHAVERHAAGRTRPAPSPCIHRRNARSRGGP